ncbi:MAG: hypothetical protein HYS53_03660 [Candidatus Aenigmarchaeota archaeon]|nr:hypothetical protein [Candidatus Aenigmarchaeota archaeon]
MNLVKLLETKLAEDISFGVSMKGKEAATLTVEKNRILVEIKNPVTAAEMAVKGYALSKNLKKLKARVAKASRKITVKYGVVSFDI